MLSPRVCFLEESSFTHSLVAGLPSKVSASHTAGTRAESRAAGWLCADPWAGSCQSGLGRVCRVSPSVFSHFSRISVEIPWIIKA